MKNLGGFLSIHSIESKGWTLRTNVQTNVFERSNACQRTFVETRLNLRFASVVSCLLGRKSEATAGKMKKRRALIKLIRNFAVENVKGRDLSRSLSP